MAQFIAEHRAGSMSRPKGLNRRELFDDLDEAKRACNRWQRSECQQAIVDTSTGERWVRIDFDREWNLSQPDLT